MSTEDTAERSTCSASLFCRWVVATRGIVALASLAYSGFWVIAMVIFLNYDLEDSEYVNLKWRIPSAIAASVVAFVSIPPVTDQLRSQGMRWFLAAMVLAAAPLVGVVTIALIEEVQLGASLSTATRAIVIPMIVTNTCCLVFVARRVLRWQVPNDSNHLSR